jgi:hypothetical protein
LKNQIWENEEMTPAKNPESKTSTETNRNLTKVRLSKPVNWDGQEITELGLDLESLTGEDLVAAEREFQALNPGFIGVASLTTCYSMCLAARLVKRPVDDINKLPIKDCLQISREIDAFLS